MQFISCLEAGKQEEGCTSRCRRCVSLMLGKDKQTGALASQEAGNLDQMRTLRQGSATLAAVVRFASWWQQIVKVSADNVLSNVLSYFINHRCMLFCFFS